MTNEVKRGVILRSVNGGYGLLQCEGQTIFARGGLRGEDVSVSITSRRKGVLFGDVRTVHSPHPLRRTPPCAVASRCGGCQFQMAAPEAQTEAKRESLLELLDRAHIRLPLSKWTSGPEWGWRSRLELHGGVVDGAFALGFFQERSHQLVPAPGCMQVSARVRSLIERLTRALEGCAGSEGSIEIAESFDERATVVLASDQNVVSTLHERFEDLGISGLALRVSRDEARTIEGDPRVGNEVGGVSLRHHVLSFFQANRFLTGALLDTVVEAASASFQGPMVDLFAGVGLFAIPLARRGFEVTAIEWASTAFVDLERNVKANDVEVTRLELSVGTALASGLDIENACVVVDPPRRGLDPMELDAIARGGPARVVYVSCDPATLVRDLGRFNSHGYRPVSIEGFDMFPTTSHIETVTVLEHA